MTPTPASSTSSAFHHVLASDPHASNEPDIADREAWFAKRDRLRAVIREYLGEPEPIEAPEPTFTVLSRVRQPLYEQYKIEYAVEANEKVRAHLLVPHEALRRDGAAVLCQHGTAQEAKDTQLGISAKPRRDYGRFLAEHGFITLSPDHICAGERLTEPYAPYDTIPFYKRHPNWSAVGKTIWDGQRALDVLGAMPEVDANRLATVGHSLGGYGSMFVGAFDERLRATVCSCGLTTWAGNPQAIKFARDSWYVHLPQLREIFLADDPLPFEFHEVAALIAPRGFLNISGMADQTYGVTETLPEVARQLNALWTLLGGADRFGYHLFGGGHDVPHAGRLLTLGWLEAHLGVASGG